MIYSIYSNFKQFSVFVINDFDLCEHLGDDALFLADPSPVSYLDKWKTIKIEFANYTGIGKAKPIPDIIKHHGKLFLSDKAYQALHVLLTDHGEFLPVIYEGGKGFIFNSLRVADDLGGLDKRLSIKNHYGDIESLFFHQEIMEEYPLFRTEFDGLQGVYCLKEFKEIVEQQNLKGVVFGTDLGSILPSNDLPLPPITH